MIKSVDYSFPKVYLSAEKLFSAEINKLTKLWNTCCKNFEDNANKESAFISAFAYEDPQETVVESSCGIVAGTVCLVAGLHLASPFFGCLGGSSIAFSTYTWTSITDMKNQFNQFMDVRLEAHRTIEKVERCIKLMNQIGEFSSAWETAKDAPSDETIRLLFKSFRHVQKAELGILTDKIDDATSLHLMDDLCNTTTPKLEIMEEWKSFSERKTTQPPKIKYFKTTATGYYNYIINREKTTDLQVTIKIGSLQTYVAHAF